MASSIISSTAKSRRSTAAQTSERTTDEFEGYWLNAGLPVGTEENNTFARLNRGIAVSDLKIRKIYESMDPDYAAEVKVMNQVVRAIQAKCKAGMKEGEMIPINLEVRLYRRIEEADVEVSEEEDASIESALFG